MSVSKQIAILGGSFDPIHLGHLAVAREVLSQMELDRIWFLPAWQSPNKSSGSTTSPLHRMAMVRCAIEGVEQFELCDLEFQRKGASYTHQTLEALHQLQPETDWFWILGLDTFIDFPGWKNPADILKLANLIVVPRPGYDEARIKAILSELGADLPQEMTTVFPEEGVHRVGVPSAGSAIHFLSGPREDLSSSQLRIELANNPAAKKRLPPPVVQYIMDHQLYL